MIVQDFSEKLGYEALFVPDPNAEISDGYTSDLLSDVMANAPENGVLVTIQAHKNTVAVCGLAGIRAIVLCNSRTPDEGMREASDQDGIAIFTTSKNQFQVSAEISALL